jgi:hypothetical protein
MYVRMNMEIDLCVMKIVKTQCTFVNKHERTMFVGQTLCAKQQKGENSWPSMIW